MTLKFGPKSSAEQEDEGLELHIGSYSEEKALHQDW